MNYKKLIASRLSSLSNRSADKSEAIIGLLAGLAVGAVLGVLFAPDSGKRTRERISDKALGVTDNLKDGYHSVKERMASGKESLMGLKDRMVHGVKDKADAVSREFKDFKNAEEVRIKSGIKVSANAVNDDIQNA
uniref:YtxH domain-containing protein n=1 Tax=Pedobacter schmidteae TaxID=2201271 RepID=UPI000EABBAC3|nr:YtxH domain-containing protein [Pedobacter schmidteae]